MHSGNSFVTLSVLKEDYQNLSKILVSFLLLNPVSFYGHYYET